MRNRSERPAIVVTLAAGLIVANLAFLVWLVRPSRVEHQAIPEPDRPRSLPEQTRTTAIEGKGAALRATRQATDRRSLLTAPAPMFGVADQVQLWDRGTDAPIPHARLSASGPGFRSSMLSNCQGKLRLTPEQLALVTELGSSTPQINRALRFATIDADRITITLPAHLHVHLPPGIAHRVGGADAALLVPLTAESSTRAPRSYPLILAGHDFSKALYLTDPAASPIGREPSLRLEILDAKRNWIAHHVIRPGDFGQVHPAKVPTFVSGASLSIQLPNPLPPTVDYPTSVSIRRLDRDLHPSRPHRDGLIRSTQARSDISLAPGVQEIFHSLYAGEFELTVQHPAFGFMHEIFRVQPEVDLTVALEPDELLGEPTTVRIQVTDKRRRRPSFACELEWLDPTQGKFRPVATHSNLRPFVPKNALTAAGIYPEALKFLPLAPGRHRVTVHARWENSRQIGLEDVEWVREFDLPQQFDFTYNNSDIVELRFELDKQLAERAGESLRVDFFRGDQPFPGESLDLEIARNAFYFFDDGEHGLGGLPANFFEDFGPPGTATASTARTTHWRSKDYLIRASSDLEYNLPQYTGQPWSRGSIPLEPNSDIFMARRVVVRLP